MQAYVSLGSRSPAERSTPIYPTRQYRQIGRPNVNRLESMLTPNGFKHSNFTLPTHGASSCVTLNDNSLSFFSGATSPISSAPSQYTPNYTNNQQSIVRQRLVPHYNSNGQPRLQCQTQIIRETDPITGELLPSKVSYTVKSNSQQKPIDKEFAKAYREFENALSQKSPLSYFNS